MMVTEAASRGGGGIGREREGGAGEGGAGKYLSSEDRKSFSSNVVFNGSVLLAVMRGRASEGADFKDGAARGVVVIGQLVVPLTDSMKPRQQQHPLKLTYNQNMN